MRAASRALAPIRIWGTDMGNYRLSVVDPKGVTHIYEVNCDCDAAARRAAQSMLQEFPIEIWHGERWVGALDCRANETVH